MIPGRGLRWSSQTIGIGRRRIEPFSARQFSSSIVHHGPVRASPLLFNRSASIPRPYTRSQPSKTNILIQNGAGVRFASTTPAAPAVPVTTPKAPATEFVDEVSSSSASSPSGFTTSLDSATDFTSDSLYNMPEQIGYLKTLGLDYGWGPTALVEWTLEHIHVFAGTPWWVSIALTAVAFRAIMFKPYINAAENGTKLATIMPIIKPLQAQMSEASRAGKPAEVWKLRQELQMIKKRAGISFYKSFIPFLQIFMGYGTYMLLRAMAKLPVPGLETGGMLWFTNLTVPDPMFLFPIGTSLVLHWVLRKGGETGISTMTPSTLKAMMYFIPAMSFIFTIWFPAAVQLSFFVSGVLSYFQATLFKQPWFRNWANMSPLPTPGGPAAKSPSPYKGTLRISANAALSQNELNSRFQGAAVKSVSSQVEKVKSPLQKLKAPDFITDALGTKDEMIERANNYMDKKRATSEAANRKAFEKKRQEQLKKERWELENQRRAERAAKRDLMKK